MRIITTNIVFLACLATAFAHHVHGPDCVHHQPLINSLRPSYYTIPGYDLIIPAEEIDGVQNRIIYNEPLPPLEPIVFKPEVPLQKFVPISIPVAPAPCLEEHKENETAKAIGELSNLIHELASHKPAEVAPPQIQWLPPPPPRPIQPIVHVTAPPALQPIVHVTPAPVQPIVHVTPPPVVPFVPKEIVAIPPPPALPPTRIINHAVPIAPVVIPEAPLPVQHGGAFSYHQLHKDGSVSHFGADKSTVQVNVSPAVSVTPLPPAFVDVTPKPIVLPIPPQPIIKPLSLPPAPVLESFGPVKLHQHSVNNVVKVPKVPCVTPIPLPRPVGPILNIPAPTAVVAPIPPPVVPVAPVSGSGFSYHQHHIDGSITSYGDSKTHQNIEILNRQPIFNVPQPPSVFVPAKSDVKVEVKESSAPVIGSGYSFNLHNGDGSVSSYGGSNGHQNIEILNRGPIYKLPQPPSVYVPAKSDVKVEVKESSAPVIGSGYSFNIHNGDGSVSSYGGSKGHHNIEILNQGPVLNLPQPPSVFVPTKSDVKVEVKENSSPVKGLSGGFVYKTVQNDGTVTTYGAASPATQVISGPSPLKVMVNRVQELSKGKTNIYNNGGHAGFSYKYGSDKSAVTVSPVSVPAAPLLNIPSPTRNVHVSTGNGFSYKLENNKLIKIPDWSDLPRVSTTPLPTVHITSGPVFSTQSSVSESSSQFGYKFSHSTPSPNFVSSTSAPIFSSFSQNPIVVPDVGGYSYKQTNTDGSSIEIGSDQTNHVTVSVNDSGRGDIP